MVNRPFWIITWWRHQMETFSALLAICAGNSPVPCEFPTQMPVTRSFDVYFDLRLNKRLCKQSWPFVRGIHRSPVNSPHKGQWRWALMFILICVWINGCVNNREVGDLRRYCAHYDATLMSMPTCHLYDTQKLKMWMSFRILNIKC